MSRTPVPQPGIDRMTPFAEHPVVVGVVPGQHDLVALTAMAWARAAGAPIVYFAFADTSRYVVEEHADGYVLHAPIDPDVTDDAWHDVERGLRDQLAGVLGAQPVPWEVRYLAGRPDRALTHLARAVDAAVIVVGTRASGNISRVRELVEGSVAMHLAHHQHRPVLTVPLAVVHWREIRAPWEQ